MVVIRLHVRPSVIIIIYNFSKIFNEQQIFRLLNDPESDLYVHPVHEKDKARYKSDVYDIIWLIYDDEDKVVIDYNVCSICKDLIPNKQGSNGTSKLRRHPCFKAYDDEKKQKQLLKLMTMPIRLGASKL